MGKIVLLRSIGVFLTAVLAISGCTSSSLDKSTAPLMTVSPVADKPSVLATIQDDYGTSAGDLRITFARTGKGVVYIVGRDPRISVVHNGKKGSLYEGIGSVAVSPDGSRAAYSAMADGKWYMVVDGKAGEPYTMVEGPLFSPDGRHIAYQAMKNDLWHLVVDATVNPGTKARNRELEFSGDSQHIVYIDTDDKGTRRLVVSDIAFNKKHIIAPGVISITLNSDRTAVAAISRNSAGRERVIQFNVSNPDAVTKGAEYDKVINAEFAPTRSDLVYFGRRQGKLYVVFKDSEEILPDGVMPENPVIHHAGTSVGVLMSANNKVYLYEMFRFGGRRGNEYDEAEWLVYSSDGSISAFAARKGKSWSIVVNGKEGPGFDRVVTPKFSPDGKYLVYRARRLGKRFVVVADASGKILHQHPKYEQVFDVEFTSDGSSVAYGVKDGKKLCWKVEKLDSVVY